MNKSGWPKDSRRTVGTCALWLIGCSVRSAKPMTRYRRLGCGLSRSGTNEFQNLTGWLTTVVARVCLDILRTRKSRREESIGSEIPELRSDVDPEHEALMADSVGLALMVVLDRLNPAERLAFVLHDLFAIPFEEIAGIVERSPEAARQLASRARRRVRGAPANPGADIQTQRVVADAFLSALHRGDVNGLVEVLDPDVVFRADAKAAATSKATEVRGAETWARGSGPIRSGGPVCRTHAPRRECGPGSGSSGTLIASPSFFVRRWEDSEGRGRRGSATSE